MESVWLLLPLVLLLVMLLLLLLVLEKRFHDINIKDA